MVNALNDVCARHNNNVYVGSATKESNYSALNNAMVQLKNDCVTLANSSTNTKGRTVAAAISGVVTSVAGALGYHIVDEIQKQERSQAEQEAIKKFMDEVGSKIHCYIGADEVGRYGDVISTSME